MSCSTGVEFETMLEQFSHRVKEKILRDRNEEQKFMTSLWEDCLKLNSVRKKGEGSKKEIQELREEIQELREEIKRTKEENKKTKEEIQGFIEEFERRNAEMDEFRKDSREELNMLMEKLAHMAPSPCSEEMNFSTEFETMCEQLMKFQRENLIFISKILADRMEDQNFMTSIREDFHKLKSVRKQKEESKKEIQELIKELKTMKADMDEELKTMKAAMDEELKTMKAGMEEFKNSINEVMNSTIAKVADSVPSPKMVPNK